MNEMIESLQIFLKYMEKDVDSPFVCCHDILYVHGPDISEVLKADVERLDGLGFFWDDDLECWASFRFGSA